eukprot:TRINITY_DN3277_c0_g2_i1.p1 TRINITY_DN3277_c0_g2~~TRINITY_DN3277_c0_g2_i1.p1  ORF type:complete len:137 (-),score=14.03 TRINITY_DN3277_c0_g2_i1:656-1066(-)
MCIRDSINAEYGNRIRIARRLWEADHSLPPISKKRARSMSDDAPNTGPGKTEIPPVDGCGIFTTSVEEGQSKMEAPKEDQGVPSSGGEIHLQAPCPVVVDTPMQSLAVPDPPQEREESQTVPIAPQSVQRSVSPSD